MTVQRLDRYGRPLPDDDDVIPDGGRVRVPMPFMDHMSLALRRALALQDTSVHDGMGHVAGHKPGYCFPAEVKPVTIPTDLTDRAVKARDQYLTDLASAWRNPTSKPATKPKPTQQQDGEQARAAYVQRISNAWKHP